MQTATESMAPAVSYARASERRGLRRKILCSGQPAGADDALMRMCTDRGRVWGGAGRLSLSAPPEFPAFSGVLFLDRYRSVSVIGPSVRAYMRNVNSILL